MELWQEARRGDVNDDRSLQKKGKRKRYNPYSLVRRVELHYNFIFNTPLNGARVEEIGITDRPHCYPCRICICLDFVFLCLNLYVSSVPRWFVCSSIFRNLNKNPRHSTFLSSSHISSRAATTRNRIIQYLLTSYSSAPSTRLITAIKAQRWTHTSIHFLFFGKSSISNIPLS